jgi:hypothetical protein
LLMGATIMAGTAREPVWTDLRCHCGSDAVMALRPGFSPGGGAMMLFEEPVTPDRAWCARCWRASFVSDTAARALSP